MPEKFGPYVVHTNITDRQTFLGELILGARLRGRTATQRSKKGSEKAPGRVLGAGFSEGF